MDDATQKRYEELRALRALTGDASREPDYAAEAAQRPPATGDATQKLAHEAWDAREATLFHDAPDEAKAFIAADRAGFLAGFEAAQRGDDERVAAQQPPLSRRYVEVAREQLVASREVLEKVEQAIVAAVDGPNLTIDGRAAVQGVLNALAGTPAALEAVQRPFPVDGAPMGGHPSEVVRGTVQPVTPDLNERQQALLADNPEFRAQTFSLVVEPSETGSVVFDADGRFISVDDLIASQRPPVSQGPARVQVMPPAPETARRFFEAYCPVCATHEGMFEPGDERVQQKADEHNALHLSTPLPGPVSPEQREAMIEFLGGGHDYSGVIDIPMLADAILARFSLPVLDVEKVAAFLRDEEHYERVHFGGSFEDEFRPAKAATALVAAIENGELTKEGA